MGQLANTQKLFPRADQRSAPVAYLCGTCQNRVDLVPRGRTRTRQNGLSVQTGRENQRTVQGAFREVSDALIAYQRNQEFYTKQQDLTQANRDAANLANVRYEGGVTSYLEVLYNEQQLFDAEFGLAQARRNELLSVVQLYRALGGGWIEPGAQRAKRP